MTSTCNDELTLDDDVWFVCDLEPDHHGDHAEHGTAPDGRTYRLTWTRTPDVVSGEVIG